MNENLLVVYRQNSLLDMYFPKVLKFVPEEINVKKIIFSQDTNLEEIKYELERALDEISEPILYFSDHLCGKYGNLFPSREPFEKAEKRGLEITEDMETSMFRIARHYLIEGGERATEIFKLALKKFMPNPKQILILGQNIAYNSQGLAFGQIPDSAFAGQLKNVLEQVFPASEIELIHESRRDPIKIRDTDQMIVADYQCRFLNRELKIDKRNLFLFPPEKPISTMLFEGIDPIGFEPEEIYEDIILGKWRRRKYLRNGY